MSLEKTTADTTPKESRNSKTSKPFRIVTMIMSHHDSLLSSVGDILD
jgi:hypothetical protein